MLPAAAIPVILSAVPALLRYRQKMDEILSLNETTASLPFLLPPDTSVYNNRETCDVIVAYFKPPSDTGALDYGAGYGLLKAKGFESAYHKFVDQYRPNEPRYPFSDDAEKLYILWCHANRVKPQVIGPTGSKMKLVSDPDMQLAYYMVKSARLSRNNVWTRMALATADTLMEVAGTNAGLFVKDPKLRPIFATLFNQFSAVEFDDDGIEDLFKRLLGSAIIAVGQNADKLAKHSALESLSRAFIELGSDERFTPTGGDTNKERNEKLKRKRQIKDLAAYILTAEGFTDLVSVSLVEVSRDNAFHTGNDNLNNIIKATLEEAILQTDYKNFEILRKNPGALVGILEAGIHAAALNAPALLEKAYGHDLPQGKLFLAVTSAALKHVENEAAQRQFIDKLIDGSLLPAVIRTSLTAVAANPELISQAADVDKIVGEVTAAFAEGLAAIDADTKPEDFLNDFLKKMATTLAEQPSLLGVKDPYAIKVLTATLTSAAKFEATAIRTDQIMEISQSALAAASSNLALTKLETKYALLLESVGTVIATQSAERLKTAEGWKLAMLAAIDAISSNPNFWKSINTGSLLKDTIQAVVAGLNEDPSDLLSEETFVSCLRGVLLVLARHGQLLVDKNVSYQTLQAFLKLILEAANKELGKQIGREDIAEFVQSSLAAFILSPFALTSQAKLNTLIKSQLKELQFAP